MSNDKSMQYTTDKQTAALISRINALLIKNKALTKEARTEFEKYALEIGKGASADRLSEINKKLTDTENSMRGLHRLGALLKGQMNQARESFFKWFSAGSIVKSLLTQTEKAISEIREMDTLLTRIGLQNDALSASALQDIARQAFDAAGRYGKTAADSDSLNSPLSVVNMLTDALGSLGSAELVEYRKILWRIHIKIECSRKYVRFSSENTCGMMMEVI